MPGAGAGKRRSAPGVATSNTNSMGRGGGAANEAQPPTSSPTISAASAGAPPAVVSANMPVTLNQPAAPSTATQQLSTGAPGPTSPTGATPASVSPSRSLHSSHSPSHHRSSTRHRLLQVSLASGMEGLHRISDPDSRPRSRNRSRVPVSVLQHTRAYASANGSGDQDSSAIRMPRLLPKRLAELSGNKLGTGIKKVGSKVIRSGWPKRKHPLPVSPLASAPVSRGTAISTPMTCGETRMTNTSTTPAPSTPPPTITFTMAPTTTVSSRPHTPNRTPTRSVSPRIPRQSPTRSLPHTSLPRTLSPPISRNTARITQPHSPYIPTAPPKIPTNSPTKSLPLNSSKTPINSPSKTSSISSSKTPLSTFPRVTPNPPSKATPNSISTSPNSLSRAFTRARFSHVSRTPFRESKFMNPDINGSLGDTSNSIPSGPSSIAATCLPAGPLSDPLSSLSNTATISGPNINSSHAPTTNVTNTQTSSTTMTYVTAGAPPFRGLRAFLNERKMKSTSPHIAKPAPSSGVVTDLDSVSELPTSTPIDASVLSRIYGISPNSASRTVLTPAALPLVRACFRMLQRSSGNEQQLKSCSASSRLSAATDGDVTEMSISKTLVPPKSRDQCEKRKFETMTSLNSKPKDRLENTSQKSREIPDISKGSINPLTEDSLDCKTLSQRSSNTILRPAIRKSSKEVATSTGSFFERRHLINAGNLTQQSTTTVGSVTSKRSTASQTVPLNVSKSKSPLRVAKAKTPTKQQQKVARTKSPLSSRTSPPRSPPRTPNANNSLDRKYLRSKISRHRPLSRLSLHNSRKKIVKRKHNPVLQKPTSKVSIRSRSTQTRVNLSEKEDMPTTNTTVPDEVYEKCPLKDFDFGLPGLPVLLWPSPVASKHSNQEGSGDVLSKTEAQFVRERMVMVPAHRVEQALGLLQRQQRLLQSVLRTTPEGPPASRGGDHHRREKWGTVTPKGSKSPTAKRKTGSSSATDVRRTRKRSRKNKKRKTVQGVEA